MKNLRLKMIIILLLSFNWGFVKAQIQKGELKRNAKISAEITSNEKHLYKVKLGKDQFAAFRLMQKGVDLQITTYNVNAEKLEYFDSPNGKNGPEFISIISTIKGEYVIEVSPLDEKQPKGSYELIFEYTKPKAISAKKQVDELFSAWNNSESPGAAVAIVKDGKIIYKNGYGMANLEYNIPIKTNSIFHIASLSKQVTVFSILLLEKSGKLSLEDDVRMYIPEVPDFGKIITLRHLASHTSGLRDQWDLLTMAGWRMDDVITKEHILKLVSKQKELNFSPGEEFLYCNTGFTLLAEVVSRVSGKPFAEFTKTNIFNPLQMNNTLFFDDHEKIVKNRAYSYSSDSTGIKNSLLSYANVGATSLFTTVEDLSLWALNFSDLKVGDTAIVNKMNELAVLNNGKTYGGALGQFVGKYKGLNEIQHGGADAGYRTFLTRFPDQNFSVIVFSNSASFNAGAVAHKIVDIYLKDLIKEEPKQDLTKEKALTANISINQNILKSYVGNYELRPGLILSVTQNNGQLYGQPTGQSNFPLMPLSINEFAVKGVEATITFIGEGMEQVKQIKLSQGGKITDASRIKSYDQTIKLSDFEGKFYSEELTTTYEFKMQGKKLVAMHNRLSNVNLEPITNDVFSGDSYALGQIKFIRDANNIITGCTVSSARAKNIYFHKVN